MKAERSLRVRKFDIQLWKVRLSSRELREKEKNFNRKEREF